MNNATNDWLPLDSAMMPRPSVFTVFLTDDGNYIVSVGSAFEATICDAQKAGLRLVAFRPYTDTQVKELFGAPDGFVPVLPEAAPIAERVMLESEPVETEPA